MQLYSFNGNYPSALPFRIVLSNGLTRTNPETFTEAELLDAGYVAVNDKPEVTEYQSVSWDSNILDWSIVDFSKSQIQEIIQANFEKAKSAKLELLSEIISKEMERPRVPTPYGFDVDGSLNDLNNFEVALDLGLDFVRNADNQSRSVTSQELETIILLIKQNGLLVYNLKWDLEDEIRACTTIEELELITLPMLEVEEV